MMMMTNTSNRNFVVSIHNGENNIKTKDYHGICKILEHTQLIIIAGNVTIYLNFAFMLSNVSLIDFKYVCVTFETKKMLQAQQRYDNNCTG